MEHDIGADDLAEGTVRTAKAGGHTILLAKIAGRCHAIANTCPHAGGPLNEGVLRGHTITCPWHKAAFDVTTGRRTEPPAVDDLPCYTTRIAGGRVLVELCQPKPAIAEPATDDRCMAIVGAGAAGFAAAQTLREQGFAGRVVMIGAEGRLPYDRTILSKYALSGEKGGEKTPLQDQAFYDRHAIERVTRRVTGIDPATRTITFEDGGTLGYHAALAATGGTPRRPTMQGASLPGVFTLRGPDDSEAIVHAARHARSAVIAGAGFIAMEAAASLRQRGLQVTVVAPQSAPFERQLGAAVGGVVQRLHEAQGITFHLQDEVAAIEGQDRVQSVRLKSGIRLDTSLVIAGLGVTPNTEALQGVTRQQDGGVLVDSHLRAADGLYAAGDIAAFPSGGHGPPIRVEHWRVAQQHGRTAALNMLGTPTRYAATPYFWTIHFTKRLDYIGHAEHWDELVLDGDVSSDKPCFAAFYIQSGQVAAIAGWDRDRQMAAAIGLMTERRWTAVALRRALTE